MILGRRFFCPRRGRAAFCGRGEGACVVPERLRTQGGGRKVRMRFFLRCGEWAGGDGLVIFFRPETERQRAAQWTVLQDVLAYDVQNFLTSFLMAIILSLKNKKSVASTFFCKNCFWHLRNKFSLLVSVTIFLAIYELVSLFCILSLQ